MSEKGGNLSTPVVVVIIVAVILVIGFLYWRSTSGAAGQAPLTPEKMKAMMPTGKQGQMLKGNK